MWFINWREIHAIWVNTLYILFHKNLHKFITENQGFEMACLKINRQEKS